MAGLMEGAEMVVTEQINMTQPSDRKPIWTRHAKSAGLSLAEWIDHQCQRALTAAEKKRLAPRIALGNKRKAIK